MLDSDDLLTDALSMRASLCIVWYVGWPMTRLMLVFKLMLPWV